jgi:hypothetical protein
MVKHLEWVETIKMIKMIKSALFYQINLGKCYYRLEIKLDLYKQNFDLYKQKFDWFK